MGNWMEQELGIIGSSDDIDRFCKLAVTGTFRGEHRLKDEPTFLFSMVCPVGPGDRRASKDEHETGVILRFIRSSVQANFSMLTKNSFPRHFYVTRLCRDWPRLSFCCAINDEDGWCGGVILGWEGKVTDAVEDYGGDYDRRAHARRVRPLLASWNRIALKGRPWRAVLKRLRWHGSYDVDATFSDVYKVFYFHTEDDCRGFARRFKGASVRRK